MSNKELVDRYLKDIGEQNKLNECYNDFTRKMDKTTTIVMEIAFILGIIVAAISNITIQYSEGFMMGVNIILDTVLLCVIEFIIFKISRILIEKSEKRYTTDTKRFEGLYEVYQYGDYIVTENWSVHKGRITNILRFNGNNLEITEENSGYTLKLGEKAYNIPQVLYDKCKSALSKKDTNNILILDMHDIKTYETI